MIFSIIHTQQSYNQHMNSSRIEKTLGDLLIQKECFIATAESCTGGLIADRITDIPGSSRYFLGGMVTYSNKVKMKWLGVSAETLKQYGAVSQQTVKEMAAGLASNLKTICPSSNLLTIAVSGIAGPDGGTPAKPVGYVWIGWSFRDVICAEVFHFQGDRVSIKNQSADQALSGALQLLQK